MAAPTRNKRPRGAAYIWGKDFQIEFESIGACLRITFKANRRCEAPVCCMLAAGNFVR
jgi:hypothetical protein